MKSFAVVVHFYVDVMISAIVYKDVAAASPDVEFVT